MSKSSTLKGAIFEWFVKNILKSCGFTEVKQDNEIVYNSSSGLMVHGLGQAHNADVLMYPPFQIPFYFPSRLLIECKAYKKKVGLPIIRGLLGLREDINNFEIVTPLILRRRRSYRSRKRSSYPYDRFSYQVALATIKEVRKTAQDFALTHHIPIISFYDSSRYKFLRDFINKIDEPYCNSLGEEFKEVLSYFKKNDSNSNISSTNEELMFFIDQSKELFKHMYVGVLENGTIIFLYGETPKFKPDKIEINSEIRWKTEDSEWKIDLKGFEDKQALFFELPPRIYNDWADKEFDKKEAISIKEKEFKRITIFGIENGNLIFFILNLDLDFIKAAKINLDRIENLE